MNRPIRTRITALLLALLLAAVLVLPAAAVEDSEHDAYVSALTLAGFPASYLEPLWQLHKQYPLWVFAPFTPTVSWSAALDKESALGVSLVQSSSPSAWKSTQDGAYNWTKSAWVTLDSGGWVQASREIIAFYLDPRNFLDSIYVFQFLDQRFNADEQNLENLRSMLAGTFLGDDSLDLDNDASNGVDRYSNTIYAAGEQNNLSPYVIASIILQEQGSEGASASISGVNSRFPGYYNYFNVGAYQADGFTAVERGLWYAAGGSVGATSYGRPWNTRQRSILGGAAFYANEYINRGQIALYLKRFNVQGSNPCTHQYMTNVAGAASNAKTLASAYTEELRAKPLSFLIPVYTGMPDSASPLPGSAGSTIPADSASVNDKLASLTLSGLGLTPAFDRDIVEYTAVAPFSSSSVTLSATACDSAAAVSGTGTYPLSVGSNSFSVTVTAANGSQKVYTVFISRQEQLTETASGGTPQQTSAVMRGDVSGDGAIMINDLIKLRNHILGTEPLTGDALLRADADGDGTVMINDLIKLRNHILGTSALS